MCQIYYQLQVIHCRDYSMIHKNRNKKMNNKLETELKKKQTTTTTTTTTK